MSGATRAIATESYLTEPERLVEALGAAERIVFDLDGTLYDPRDFERPALAAVADWLRERSGRTLEGLAEALWSRRERFRHRPGLFDEVLAAAGLPVEWGRECRERFHGHDGRELEAAPSLRETVRALREGGRPVALVSNGPPSLQRRKLRRLGLKGLLDPAIICDPARPHELKPAIWAWRRLADWRGDRPTVHVGDDPVDAGFAAAGGARFIPFRFRNPAHAD